MAITVTRGETAFNLTADDVIHGHAYVDAGGNIFVGTTDVKEDSEDGELTIVAVCVFGEACNLDVSSTRRLREVDIEIRILN